MWTSGSGRVGIIDRRIGSSQGLTHDLLEHKESRIAGERVLYVRWVSLTPYSEKIWKSVKDT